MRVPPDAQAAQAMLREACPAITTPAKAVALSCGVTVTARSDRDDLIELVRVERAPVRVAAAIGAFDGMHVGHRALIRRASEDAARRGVPCVAVTFDPDPADVLVGPTAGSRLLSPEDRAVALLDAGADLVVTIAFTRALADLSYRDFLDGVLGKIVHVVSLHVGEDFRIGRGGAGTIDALAAYGRRRGLSIHGHALVALRGMPVTATRIRSVLASGDIELASDLLGRMPTVAGEVVHGRGEGASLGFPTANVRMDALTCMPAAGVYGGYLVVDAASPDVRGGSSAVAYAAAINVGAPPTFASLDDPAFLEANLLGFDGDLYGRRVMVVFCRRLRPARRFDSLDELVRAVGENIRWVEENLGSDAILLT